MVASVGATPTGTLIAWQVLIVVIITMITKKLETASKKMSLLALTVFSVGYLVRDVFVSALLGELATRAANFNS